MSLLRKMLAVAAALTIGAAEYRWSWGYKARYASNFCNPRVNWSRSGRWFDEYRADVPYVLPRLRQLVQYRIRRCQCRKNRLQVNRAKRKSFLEGLR